MSYALGVDLGTSFVTTAIARHGSEAADTPIVQVSARFPSAVFAESGTDVHFGEAAERRGRATPARLIRDVAARIGDDVPIAIGEDRVVAERLYALLARAAVDRISAGEGSTPAAVRIVVPDRWGPHRTGLVRDALATVGLGHVTLAGSAEAAIVAATAGRTMEPDAVIAVYDLSATGFGVAVADVRGDRARILAVDGTGASGNEAVVGGDTGGRAVDDALLRHVIASARELFVAFDSADPASAPALSALRLECVRAKEMLATEPEATIAVRLPSAEADLLLSRAVLDRIAEPAVRSTIDVMRRALRTAGVDAGELAAILLVGGSTRLPSVSRVLHEEFGRPIVTDSAPVATAATGAALGALAGCEDAPHGSPDTGSTDAVRQSAHRSRLSGLRRRIAVRAGALAGAMTAVIGVQTTVDDDDVAAADGQGSAG